MMKYVVKGALAVTIGALVAREATTMENNNGGRQQPTEEARALADDGRGQTSGYELCASVTDDRSMQRFLELTHTGQDGREAADIVALTISREGLMQRIGTTAETAQKLEQIIAEADEGLRAVGRLNRGPEVRNRWGGTYGEAGRAAVAGRVKERARAVDAQDNYPGPSEEDRDKFRRELEDPENAWTLAIKASENMALRLVMCIKEESIPALSELCEPLHQILDACGDDARQAAETAMAQNVEQRVQEGGVTIFDAMAGAIADQIES
ncbi:MAG: hypothetical protein LBJ42_01715, partial [Holosporales bacterium]|nr:hypothetical protein [Holosporales bacterium]